ncbi:hypothetical protein FGU65_02280 [Methanoculleus sp. FWC-SCC1]|uniref:Uncharacterized protein n=1 Tax=Methanoculleus frigidifontis TaxID=2584085 RepID=A0ABT8M724_9EURY|nr:hypothetical protein [Methanoculleus sp. FWC-SCC1]MDN7023733.1 hypothetical protein [Methanoculleus sp. FWC-SCC1]
MPSARAAAALLLAALVVGASLFSIDLLSLIDSSVLTVFYWAVVIALLLVIAVRAEQWLEKHLSAVASSSAAADLAALRQSLERIEKKVDTIEGILAKVAE